MCTYPTLTPTWFGHSTTFLPRKWIERHAADTSSWQVASGDGWKKCFDAGWTYLVLTCIKAPKWRDLPRKFEDSTQNLSWYLSWFQSACSSHGLFGDINALTTNWGPAYWRPWSSCMAYRNTSAPRFFGRGVPGPLGPWEWKNAGEEIIYPDQVGM